MKPFVSQIVRVLRGEIFGLVDERIYAVVRAGFAAAALINLATLWPLRYVIFSSTGMIDEDVVIASGGTVYVSLFEFIRTPTAISAYLVFTAVCLFMLMLGIAPRIAAVAVFVWHLSYHARAPLALTGWDCVLHAFSFLIMISPLGKTWSLSPWRPRVPLVVSAYGLTLMRLQVLVLYWQTVALKLTHTDPSWRNGEFMSYFLLSRYSRYPELEVLNYPGLLAFVSWMILVVELAIPVFLFVSRTRYWGALLGFLLHGGICLFSHYLELFSLTMAMSYLAFLRDRDIGLLLGWISRRKFVRERNAPR